MRRPPVTAGRQTQARGRARDVGRAAVRERHGRRRAGEEGAGVALSKWWARA